MFERFTTDARRVIFLARYEAMQLASPVLETGHLWLGLLRQDQDAVARLAPHITKAFICERPKQPSREAAPTTNDVPLSVAAKRVTAAAAGPEPHSSTPITVDDLIFALLRQDSARSAGETA